MRPSILLLLAAARAEEGPARALERLAAAGAWSDAEALAAAHPGADLAAAADAGLARYKGALDAVRAAAGGAPRAEGLVVRPAFRWAQNASGGVRSRTQLLLNKGMQMAPAGLSAMMRNVDIAR